MTLAFGMNAYIQISVFKSREEGDFTEGEMAALREIYTYVANSYKNFKKYEQAKIVSTIQSKIISSGESSYMVTDDFMHILDCNKAAQSYLEEILGMPIGEQISSKKPCGWLTFLLSAEEENDGGEERPVRTRRIGTYMFKIYTYDQSYSNGIVDRYYWITISEREEARAPGDGRSKAGKNGSGMPEGGSPLTQTERKVAELMYRGLTYKAIADELVVSYHTVKKHVQNIYTKCGVKSRYQLYKWMERQD